MCQERRRMSSAAARDRLSFFQGLACVVSPPVQASTWLGAVSPDEAGYGGETSVRVGSSPFTGASGASSVPTLQRNFVRGNRERGAARRAMGLSLCCHSRLKHIFSSKSNCLRCLWVSACVLCNNAVSATSE